MTFSSLVVEAGSMDSCSAWNIKRKDTVRGQKVRGKVPTLVLVDMAIVLSSTIEAFLSGFPFFGLFKWTNEQMSMYR
jgi:hypothetical protein